MSDSLSNLEWFFDHCIQYHYLLDTGLPIYDVAKFIMEYIINLDIKFVSNKVKTELAYHLRVYTQSTSERLPLYVKPIAILLIMQLINDENFSVKRLKALFLLNTNPTIVREAQPTPRGLTRSRPGQRNLSCQSTHAFATRAKRPGSRPGQSKDLIHPSRDSCCCHFFRISIPWDI